jgi:hypothetical protein
MNRCDAERFLLFCMLVAGKRSEVQDRKLTQFLTQSIVADYEGTTFTMGPAEAHGSPFEWIRCLDDNDLLERACRKHKLGKYSTLVPGFRELVRSDAEVGGIDILDTDPEELQQISGIGPKTAKFYCLRLGLVEDAAALDTHILQWMQEQGYDAPDVTPSGAEYDRLQQAFVEEAENRGLTPSELDARIWNDRSDSNLEAKASLK